MNKVSVTSSNPAELLNNVVSVTDDGESSKCVVIQVTKTLQRSFVIPTGRILRHVDSPDNKGSLLLANHHITLEFKDATVEQVAGGFAVHTGDDKVYFFNGAYSSYVVEGKQSVSKADDDEDEVKPATTATKKTTAKATAGKPAAASTKKATSKAKVEVEEDEEDFVEADEKPAKKTAAKPAAKPATSKKAPKVEEADDIIDDDDEVEVKPAKKAAAKPAAKPATSKKATKAKVEVAEDTDDWGDDD